MKPTTKNPNSTAVREERALSHKAPPPHAVRPERAGRPTRETQKEEECESTCRSESLSSNVFFPPSSSHPCDSSCLPSTICTRNPWLLLLALSFAVTNKPSRMSGTGSAADARAPPRTADSVAPSSDASTTESALSPLAPPRRTIRRAGGALSPPSASGDAASAGAVVGNTPPSSAAAHDALAVRRVSDDSGDAGLAASASVDASRGAVAHPSRLPSISMLDGSDMVASLPPAPAPAPARAEEEEEEVRALTLDVAAPTSTQASAPDADAAVPTTPTPSSAPLSTST